MIVTALKELGSTTSINSKKEILKKYKDDYIVNTSLMWACDPSLMFNIKKLPKLGIGNEGIETFNEFLYLLKILNAREITGNKAIAACVSLLERCDMETQDAYIRILKKDLKVNVSDTILRDVYGEDFIFKLKIQLANTYDPDKNYKLPDGKNYWWASRKLDGLRGFYKKLFYSRNGKLVNGFTDMEKELQHLMKAHSLNFVDGELFSDVLDFQTISSFVKKTVNGDPSERTQIYFNIFAIGINGDTDAMVEKMRLIDWSMYKYLRPIEYIKVNNNKEDIFKLARFFVETGSEGIMLRHPTIMYDFKRSNCLLKHKFFLEDDFKIMGWEEGEGRLVGTLGKFYIQGEIGDKLINCEVGSGFTDKQRKDFWKNKKKLLHTMAEIKYQNITDSPSKDGTWALRFPVFLKLKEDR